MDRTSSLNTKRPGKNTSRLHVDLRAMHDHRLLLNYLRQYYAKNLDHLDFPPETMVILESLPDLCFVPCFLMAWSLCRYSELSQLNVGRLKARYRVTIKSSKGGHLRTIAPMREFRDSQLQSLADDAPLIVVGYDRIRSSLNSIRDHFNFRLDQDILDSTHIFRHIQATYMFEQKIPMNIISDKLGHFHKSTTLRYIHKRR